MPCVRADIKIGAARGGERRREAAGLARHRERGMRKRRSLRLPATVSVAAIMKRRRLQHTLELEVCLVCCSVLDS